MVAQPDTLNPIVYIVDDNDGMRETLEALFHSVKQAVKTFASAREFLAAYSMGQPGCLIADIRMPEMSGLELYEELKRRSIDLPVIFLTGYGDVDMAVGAMKAGAVDFIAKPYKAQDLLDRVRRAVNASVQLQREKVDHDAARDGLALLTQRERQVLDLIVAGESNKRIALQLDLSLKTVEFHRANVMRKLNAASLADLMRKVIGGPQH
jgi:FixJ family two-component response regulator